MGHCSDRALRRCLAARLCKRQNHEENPNSEKAITHLSWQATLVDQLEISLKECIVAFGYCKAESVLRCGLQPLPARLVASYLYPLTQIKFLGSFLHIYVQVRCKNGY
jgi:hypothetical protein